MRSCSFVPARPLSARWISPIILAVVLGQGCVTAEEGQKMRADIEASKTLLAEVESQQKAEKERLKKLINNVENLSEQLEVLDESIKNLRQIDADTSVQISKIIEELQSMRNDVDLVRNDLGVVRNDLGKTKRSVEDILARPPATVINEEKAPKIDATKEAIIDGRTVPMDPTGHRDLARTFASEGKTASAIAAADLFLSKYGDSANPDYAKNTPLILDIYFVKGEALYMQAEEAGKRAEGKTESKAERDKLYKQAILAFRKIVEGSRDDNKDIALYKIGSSFETLGFTEDAAVFYQEVGKSYPKSPLAADAKKKAAELSKKKPK